MRKAPRFVLLPVALALAGPASALDFDLGENASLKMVNKFTIGAGVRTQDYKAENLGILNVPGQHDTCQLDDCVSFAIDNPGTPQDERNFVPNQTLLDARGGFFLHATDDGDMNYDRGEFYTGISKLNADWTLNWGDWIFKTNFVGYYDAVNKGFTVHRNNTVQCSGPSPSVECNGADANGFDTYTLGPAERARSGEIESRLAVRGEFREYFVTRSFMLGDTEIFASLGNQRLRWGEANLTLLNTLDVINPQDAVLARQPGLALNELNLPVGMLTLGADVLEGVSVDGWWQYDWEPVRPEPSGSLLSNLSDVAGGGNYAVVGLGQYPEDPDAYWFSQGTTGLVSNSHRTIYVPDEGSHAPKGLDQFGLRVKWYLPDFNNGTELGFYFANYHSRLPYASVIASEDSCMRDSQNMNEAALACHGFNAASNRGQADVVGQRIAPERCDPRGCDMTAYTAREPLPIDTMGLFLDYPESIQMYGISFNTTFGGWSFAGEYSYRPNVPAQLLLSDVVFAALQPAVPRMDIAFADLVGVPLGADAPTAARVQELLTDAGADPSAANAAVPGADTVFPCYLCAYRGYDNTDPNNDINEGEVIRGYERIKLGQFSLTALQLFSTNPFGSDDLLFVYEVGFQHVVDMPEQNNKLGEGGLFFQGSGDQSHPSQGADCTGDAAAGTTCTTLRINPTQQTEGFADDFAWGMRTLIQLNYSNVFDAGLTIKPTVLAFWDVNGIAPAPQQNFVEGNRWIVPGLFFEYGSDWSGTLLYQYFAGRYSMLGDRDNIAASITYAF